MKRYLLLIAILLAGTIAGIAQNSGRITGKVTYGYPAAGFRKDEAALRDAWNEGLNKVRDSGKLESILVEAAVPKDPGRDDHVRSARVEPIDRIFRRDAPAQVKSARKGCEGFTRRRFISLPELNHMTPAEVIVPVPRCVP